MVYKANVDILQAIITKYNIINILLELLETQKVKSMALDVILILISHVDQYDLLELVEEKMDDLLTYEIGNVKLKAKNIVKFIEDKTHRMHKRDQD